jgi:hypothetical protein
LENCESPSWSFPWWNCQVIINFIVRALSVVGFVVMLQKK